MKVALYTSRKTQECGLCGSKQVKYVVTGDGGTQYACKNKSCLDIIKAVVMTPGSVEDEIELDVTTLPRDGTNVAAPVQPAPMPATGDVPLLMLKRAVNRWNSAAKRHALEGHPRKAKTCQAKADEYQRAIEMLEPERFTVYPYNRML